jgi:hypothetical protein
MNSGNYNHGKFFSPVQVYTGYIFLAAGIFWAYYSLSSLILSIAGAFIAFTTTGTIIDIDNKKIKEYTMHFGFFRTGNWIALSQFTRFNIQRAKRRYTTYSRGSVRLDTNLTDINLLLINRNGSKKVIINRYSNFEEAQKEKEELETILFPGQQNEKTDTTI